MVAYNIDYILNHAELNHSLFCGSAFTDGDLWHHQLAHPSLDKLSLLSEKLSLPKISFNKETPCMVYPLAKQNRLPFLSHNNHTEKPFDLIHLDILGPFSQDFVEGFRYFLTVVDDFSRVTWIYLLRHKSDVKTIFSSSVTLI